MAKFKLTKKSMKQIASAYNWSTGEPIELSPRLSYTTCPRWRFPGAAPIFLTTPRLRAEDLRAVESYFDENPPKYLMDARAPYVMWLQDPFFESKANIALAQNKGWTPDKPPTYLNLWTQVQPLIVPDGFEVVASHWGSEVSRDSMKLMQQSFQSSNEFMRDVDWSNMKSRKSVVCIMVYSTSTSGRRKPAATLLAQTCGNATYLYSGCVAPRFRGQGLSRVLLVAAQAFTNSGQGHIWLMTSAVDRIKRSGEYSARLHIFEKKPS